MASTTSGGVTLRRLVWFTAPVTSPQYLPRHIDNTWFRLMPNFSATAVASVLPFMPNNSAACSGVMRLAVSMPFMRCVGAMHVDSPHEVYVRWGRVADSSGKNSPIIHTNADRCRLLPCTFTLHNGYGFPPLSGD